MVYSWYANTDYEGSTLLWSTESRMTDPHLYVLPTFSFMSWYLGIGIFSVITSCFYIDSFCFIWNISQFIILNVLLNAK